MTQFVVSIDLVDFNPNEKYSRENQYTQRFDRLNVGDVIIFLNEMAERLENGNKPDRVFMPNNQILGEPPQVSPGFVVLNSSDPQKTP
jgi:hypothetical protein